MHVDGFKTAPLVTVSPTLSCLGCPKIYNCCKKTNYDIDNAI